VGDYETLIFIFIFIPPWLNPYLNLHLIILIFAPFGLKFLNSDSPLLGAGFLQI
jgi:hypothetical protein